MKQQNKDNKNKEEKPKLTLKEADPAKPINPVATEEQQIQRIIEQYQSQIKSAIAVEVTKVKKAGIAGAAIASEMKKFQSYEKDRLLNQAISIFKEPDVTRESKIVNASGDIGLRLINLWYWYWGYCYPIVQVINKHSNSIVSDHQKGSIKHTNQNAKCNIKEVIGLIIDRKAGDIADGVKYARIPTIEHLQYKMVNIVMANLEPRLQEFRIMQLSFTMAENIAKVGAITDQIKKLFDAEYKLKAEELIQEEIRKIIEANGQYIGRKGSEKDIKNRVYNYILSELYNKLKQYLENVKENEQQVENTETPNNNVQERKKNNSPTNNSKKKKSNQIDNNIGINLKTDTKIF